MQDLQIYYSPSSWFQKNCTQFTAVNPNGVRLCTLFNIGDVADTYSANLEYIC